MRRTTAPITWLVALVSVLALVGGACSGDEEPASGTGGDRTTTIRPGDPDLSSLDATLNGSGSSFQDSFQQQARTEFGQRAGGVTVNYTKSGSSAGKQDLANGVVQFAGTDSLIDPDDLDDFRGGEVLYFPVVASAITVAYHLPGVDLRLTPATLGGIFSGDITEWDDEAIVADNPDADLPSVAISVVHRSDGSGTTANFTRYLSIAAGESWTLGDGDTVPWPSETQGAEKNSGVATVIATTDGAIGYVDLADAVAADLQLAEIENAAGRFVAPTLEATAAALEGAALEADLTYDPINAPGDTAYPITSPTWVVVYAQQSDPEVAEALRAYLRFLLTDGQELARAVGFARLPDVFVDQALAQVDRIVG